KPAALPSAEVTCSQRAISFGYAGVSTGPCMRTAIKKAARKQPGCAHSMRLHRRQMLHFTAHIARHFTHHLLQILLQLRKTGAGLARVFVEVDAAVDLN